MIYLLCLVLVVIKTIQPPLLNPFCDPVILCVSFSALRRGPGKGLRLGLFSGFCLDVLSAGPWGIFIFSYAIGGYMIGWFSGKLFPDSLITQCLTTALFSTWATLIGYVASAVWQNGFHAAFAFIHDWVLSILWTACIGPCVIRWVQLGLKTNSPILSIMKKHSDEN